MAVMLIGLGHSARVGKDTVGGLLAQDHGFITVAFADALRSVAYDSREDVRDLVDVLGWDVAKTEHPWVRDYLIALGNACRSHIGSGVWIDAVLRDDHAQDLVITDVRYPNEAEAILARGGYVYRVTRPGVEPLPNVADQALVGWTGWTGEIVNDGTIEDLGHAVNEILGVLAWHDLEMHDLETA